MTRSRSVMTKLLPVAALFLGPYAQGEDPAAPDGWRFTAPRAETEARHWVERDAGGTGHALGLGGRGSEAVDGRWERAVALEPGRHHAFEARYLARRIRSADRSVLARIVWVSTDGAQVAQAEYPAPSPPGPDGWSRVAGIWKPPEGAVSARIELHFRWSADGEVLWRDVRFAAADPPSPRRVKLAAVNHRPRGGTPAGNVQRFAELVAEAAKLGADIVCLPEGITVCGTRESYASVAEAVPGPSTESLGRAAAEHRIAVAAGIYERDGAAVYNTSVLLGPDGRLLGKYRKVCLPREEIDGGIAPGKEYPVFDAARARVGMMICWDVHFPEVARELAGGGAEVILLPIWGGNEALARARAIENQIYLVTSGYDFPTTIYDPRGEPLAKASKDPEVITAEVDLAERILWPWLGDFRARIRSEAPLRAPREQPAEKWEEDIQAFEAADRVSPPPGGAVLFIGSSSTRLWKTLARDFPEHEVINRGFGGSEIEDIVRYADRIVIPYRPALIVLQAGGNDIANGKSPERVLADFKAFVEKVRAKLPGTRIAFTNLHPSPLRWEGAPKQKEANRLVREYTRSGDNLDFIELWDPFLGPDGKPREDLFESDRLHNNAEGYRIRAEAVRPHVVGHAPAIPEPIRVLRAQEEAWNRGDIDGFMEGYERSERITFSSDRGVTRGWEAVRERYRKRYPDRAAMGALAFSQLELVRLGPGSALVTGEWRLERAADSPAGVFSVILARLPEGWKIVHDHTSAFPRE